MNDLSADHCVYSVFRLAWVSDIPRLDRRGSRMSEHLGVLVAPPSSDDYCELPGCDVASIWAKPGIRPVLRYLPDPWTFLPS